MTACTDVVPFVIVRPLARAPPIVGAQGAHGGQRQPQEHTEPALPLTNCEGHDPTEGGETEKRWGDDDDDDVYYYICWRLKLEGETENICVCTKERKGVSAEVLMATPCTNSLM